MVKSADQSSGDSAGFAAKEFPGVGIFFLGHQAAAGGIFIGEQYVAEFLRREEHEVFGEPRKMRGDAGEREKIIQREIAVADGVEAVCGGARKAELAGNDFAIDGKRTTGQRSGTHRAGVGAGSGAFQARNVSQKSFRVRQQEMGKQNWLSVLHVRHARHGQMQIGFCQADERADQIGEGGLGLRGRIFDEHAEIGGHQFVAAAAGMQFPSERAKFFDQGLFDEVVDVLGIGSIEPRFFLFARSSMRSSVASVF